MCGATHPPVGAMISVHAESAALAMLWRLTRGLAVDFRFSGRQGTSNPSANSTLLLPISVT